MLLNFSNTFDIVTMVGSTAIEGGLGTALPEKAMDFVKKGGAYYF